MFTLSSEAASLDIHISIKNDNVNSQNFSFKRKKGYYLLEKIVCLK